MWKSEGYKVFAEDEAIISMNPSRRRAWAPKGSRPIQLVNGSHQNVRFFGATSGEKNHCCTADWINEDSFIRFANYLLRLYGKVVLIADQATHHFKSGKVKKFVKDCNGNLVLWPLPKKLPELNPQEQGWKSARINVTYKLFGDKKSLGWAVKSHIRWGFKINLAEFWS